MHGKPFSSKDTPAPLLTQICVIVLTASLLSFIQLRVDRPMLLIERFAPGWGWIEILALSLYAGFIAGKMLRPTQSSRWRLRIWILFSTVFFSQLLVGLFGLDEFLMTGTLHLPVPAMIVAGPLFRAERFFMPILFASTVFLVGPAWCSHLCYIGAWDAAASNHKKKPLRMPKWRPQVRMGILLSVVVVSLLLRWIGVSSLVSVGFGLFFGITGIGIMIFWSRKSGVMTHCITYCPIGLLANWFGRLSPFRIRIHSDCNGCGACRLVCRYDALTEKNIQNRTPGKTCTLCGDCIKSCKDRWIEYRFFRLPPDRARKLFIAFIVCLHTVFLGVARI
ncbi:MAG: 4Fe-4S binding protein [Candidatus Aminicenantes bacterium]|nr:4Fe-4S binding protein [Candidatus Aminicenantes bacterium]